MPQDRLAELMQHEVNASRSLIEGAGGEVINHFIGESDDASYCVVSPWGSGQERSVILLGVRELFREKKIKRYVHVGEAWLGRDRQTPTIKGS